ncbi:MAG: serine/threonine protein kinase [Deltaproteobacteria bacterium]|nr:serine/threonine protein kinase [Deltaproteobacteria bacterium]
MKRDDPDQTKVALIDPMIGVVIAGRYRLELKIASGGFGAIYRALDVFDDRDVALKLLHPRLAMDGAVIARFRREGAALSKLNNPHTVHAFEVGETPDGTLYIAMELLEGESLYDHVRQLGPIAWRRMAQIARQVCDALGEAHALGIIHRDLKPANIHLEADDFVKVLDFGIAKIVHGGELENADLTHAGQMIGTFDYMPPEQMVGGELSEQSDIFTLGIVMYEMITGQLPFGAAATASAMLAALVTKTPKAPGALADCPPELDRIILRCLARKPEDRYRDSHALADDLDMLLGNADAGEEQTLVKRITTSRMQAQLNDDPTVVKKFVQVGTTPGVGPPKKKR